MHLSRSEKKRRADINLYKTQLCFLMEGCCHHWKGSCKFAHALEELCPTPTTWNLSQGHYWEQGKPLPNQEVLDLIERYAGKSSSRLPEWVHDLRAEVLQEAERRDPPWKRARKEAKKAEQEEEESKEEGKEGEHPDELDPDWGSTAEGTGDEVAEPKHDTRMALGEEVAVPKHDTRMALLIPVVKAVLGYTELHWPASENIAVGGMLWRDRRMGFCLFGADELQRAHWIPQKHGSVNVVTVQCGSGQWATGVRPTFPNVHFDLSAWSSYEGEGSHGRMPNPGAPAAHRTECFKYLTEVLEALWTTVPVHHAAAVSGSSSTAVAHAAPRPAPNRKLPAGFPPRPPGMPATFPDSAVPVDPADSASAAHAVLIFWSRCGRHRSYAFLIAFLMWSSHIHDPKLWEAIISPIRNARLGKRHACQLATLTDLSHKQRSKVGWNKFIHSSVPTFRIGSQRGSQGSHPSEFLT